LLLGEVELLDRSRAQGDDHLLVDARQIGDEVPGILAGTAAALDDRGELVARLLAQYFDAPRDLLVHVDLLPLAVVPASAPAQCVQPKTTNVRTANRGVTEGPRPGEHPVTSAPGLPAAGPHATEDIPPQARGFSSASCHGPACRA
jgi:hypothetical protein